MSRKDFADRARSIDESTPLRTKLSFLIAIMVAAYAIGGWVNAVNGQGGRNETAISDVNHKIDVLNDKVDKLTADFRDWKYEQRGARSVAVK